MRVISSKKLIGAAAAASFLLSSTAATAASMPKTTQPNPLAVLSVMSGGAPTTVLCGAAAATAAQPMASGCVLPQVDTPPAVAQGGASQPLAMVPPAGAGLGFSPLLMGLSLIAVSAAAYFAVRKHHNNHAISPA